MNNIDELMKKAQKFIQTDNGIKIAFSGNIGVGKSTTVARLNKYLNSMSTSEMYKEFIDYELLDWYYELRSLVSELEKELKEINSINTEAYDILKLLKEELDRVEYAHQSAFSHNETMRDFKSKRSDTVFKIYDRILDENIDIFAKTVMSDHLFSFFKGIQHAHKDFLKTGNYDVHFILTCDLDENINRINKRARAQEDKVDEDYIATLKEKYESNDFKRQCEYSSDLIIYIDVTNLNEEEVLNEVITELYDNDYLEFDLYD